MMICSFENKDEFGGLREIGEIKSKVKQVYLQARFNEQGFHYDTIVLLNQIQKQLTKKVKKYFKNLKLSL